MKRKFQFISSSLLLVAVLSGDIAWSCGNGANNVHKSTQKDLKEKCTTTSKDPFVAYTGNEYREIEDLKMSGGVGEHKLSWTRFANSRYVGGKTYLGNGHNWRHGYQWDCSMTYSTASNTFMNIQIIYPDGKSFTFKPTSANPLVWKSASGVADTIYQEGREFYLQQQNGWRYHFSEVNLLGGTVINPNYKMVDFTDNYQNKYTFTYELFDWSKVLLTKVTEPGGRYFQINYSRVILDIFCVSSVHSSDGRSVYYQYETDYAQVDPLTGQFYANLVSAEYDDGTVARYVYTKAINFSAAPDGKVLPNVQPMIVEFYDPRYDMPFAKSKTVYSTSASDPVGYLLKQVNYDTGETLYTLGAVDGHTPKITDGNGGVIVNYMNYHNGSQISSTDTKGNVTQYAYDSAGFQNAIADRLGRSTRYTKSGFDNILTETLPDGSVRSYTRDSQDLPLTYKDELGRVTTWTRDARHRVTRIDYPDSSYETFSYNDFAQVLSHRLRNGGTEAFTYDATGLLTSKTDALGKTTSYGYDAYDRLARSTDANGKSTAFEYNLRGLVTKITYPDNSTRSFGYDEFGNKTSETNELGKTTSYAYDTFKRLIRVTDPLGRATQYIYRSNYYIEDKPDRVILPSGKVIANTYDTEENLVKKVVSAGTVDAATTTYEYDAENRLVAVTDPKGNKSTIAYNTRDWKTAVTDPLGNKTQWTYDAVGHALTVKRPDNGVTTNAYDIMGRLLSSIDPASRTTSYTYDTAGNLLSMTDAKGNTYSWTYDLLNRKTSMIYPDSSVESYAYDNVGNLQTFTKRYGQVLTYTYDDRYRNTLSVWNDGVTPNISKSYDTAGRLLTLGNGNSTLTYTYDDANEILSEIQAVQGQPAKTVSYAYDDDGNRQSVTYPDGTVVSYAYTGRNQLASISENGSVAASYTYDLNGLRTNKTLENGVATGYTFDVANRLTALAHKKGASTLASSAYTLNAVGNRTSKASEDGSKEDYAYDETDQLVGAKYTSNGALQREVSYAYDAVGNRQQVTDNTKVTTYDTNVLNQYTRVEGGSNADTSWNYTYDAQDRLIYAVKGLVNTAIKYDARNRVVSRTVTDENGTTTTYYVWDGWSLIGEYVNGTQTAKYIHGSSIDEILKKETPSETVYYHYDGLGNVVALTDVNGAVVEKYSYDAYGTPTFKSATGTIIFSSAHGNRFLFTGREYLQAHKLYDYRNRAYSPELGRFLQPDPMGFDAGDVNIYRYCGNNPVNGSDPMGLCQNYLNQRTTDWWLNPIVDSNIPIPSIDPYSGLSPELVRDMEGIHDDSLNLIAGFIGGKLISSLLGSAFDAVAGLFSKTEMTTVVHYTSEEGMLAITNGGNTLRAGSYVTLPGEVSGSAAKVESTLEIGAGKGAYSTTFQTPTSNLITPSNGALTSGSAVQYQIKAPASVGSFLKTP